MFEHCLYFNTTSLARDLEREWSRAFKPFGLTPPQAFMLRFILDKQAITTTDLSAGLNIAKATCSRTVDGLIGLGLIKRAPAPKDARSHELQPTTKAQDMREGINQASAEVTRRIKKIIGSEEFETTVKTLRSISTAIR